MECSTLHYFYLDVYNVPVLFRYNIYIAIKNIYIQMVIQWKNMYIWRSIINLFHIILQITSRVTNDIHSK